MMQAIILAAGTGSRLLRVSGGTPKCLLPVDGRTLLARQVSALERVGVRKIVVVVGHAADEVRGALGPQCEYVYNCDYATTNSLYSLWLARERLIAGGIVMNADILFHPRLLRDLVEARHEDALLVSYRDEDDEPFGDEEMKVTVRKGRVRAVSKSLPAEEADGENVGIARFGRAGASRLVGMMDRLIAAGAHRDWAPRAFHAFAAQYPLHAVGTRGLPWIEIDSPEDYFRARSEVAPRLGATSVVPRSPRRSSAFAGALDQCADG